MTGDLTFLEYIMLSFLPCEGCLLIDMEWVLQISATCFDKDLLQSLSWAIGDDLSSNSSSYRDGINIYFLNVVVILFMGVKRTRFM